MKQPPVCQVSRRLVISTQTLNGTIVTVTRLIERIRWEIQADMMIQDLEKRLEELHETLQQVGDRL